jgi:hypothetical protein
MYSQLAENKKEEALKTEIQQIREWFDEHQNEEIGSYNEKLEELNTKCAGLNLGGMPDDMPDFGSNEKATEEQPVDEGPKIEEID